MKIESKVTMTMKSDKSITLLHDFVEEVAAEIIRLTATSRLISGRKWLIIEDRWSCGVQKSMGIVVQVCQHVIRSEGRRYDAVYDDMFFLRDYGVQSLALHGRYCRDHVFA